LREEVKLVLMWMAISVEADDMQEVFDDREAY
jgi:hypothetical protein